MADRNCPECTFLNQGGAPPRCSICGASSGGFRFTAEEERVRKACKLLIRNHAVQKLDPAGAAGIMDRYLLDIAVFSKLKAFRDGKGPYPGLLDNSRIGAS